MRGPDACAAHGELVQHLAGGVAPPKHYQLSLECPYTGTGIEVRPAPPPSVQCGPERLYTTLLKRETWSSHSRHLNSLASMHMQLWGKGNLMYKNP